MSSIRIVHVARRELGLEEDDYRDLLERTTGQRSAKGLTRAQVDAFVDEVKRMGFRPKGQGGGKPLSGPHAKIAQKLWIAGYNLGCVYDRSDAALTNFVHRQCGIEHPNWVRNAADGRKVVEALKAWLSRDGGVDWAADSDRIEHPDWRIAFAQWQVLHLNAPSNALWMPFEAEVRLLVGRPVNECGDADWIRVMNALGVRIRQALKGGHGRRRKRRAA